MITDSEYDTWLLPLDRLATQYAEASEAFDVFKLDAVHSDPRDDRAEAAAGEISLPIGVALCASHARNR